MIITMTTKNKPGKKSKSAHNSKKVKNKTLNEEKRIDLICTTGLPDGYKLKKVIGMVWGSEVKTRGFTANIASFFRTFTGGDVPEYGNLVREARHATVDKMVQNAKSMGANGIIGVRIAASNVRSNISEFVAYGTAVVVEEK